MEPDVAIRRFRTGDEHVVAEVIEETVLQSNAADYPPDVLTDLILWHRPKHVAQRARLVTVLVAEAGGGEVVGTVTRNNDRLEAFFVLPSWQGRGVGRLLLAAIESDAVACGITLVHLDASTTAERFYRKHGYHPTATPLDGPLGRTIPLAKSLLSTDDPLLP